MTLTDEQRALVTAHVAFAYWCAQRFAPRARGVERDEAAAAALCGLTVAAGRFDPARETTFRTFAGHWCRHFISRQRQGERRRGMRQVPAVGPRLASLDAAVGVDGGTLADFL